MYVKATQLAIKFLTDEKFRQLIFKGIIAVALIFFFPIFIVMGLDHTYFQKSKNDIFTKIQMEIYSKYNVAVDTDIVRAIDTVMYGGNTSPSIINKIVMQDIIYKNYNSKKVTVDIPEKYKTKEKKLVSVTHLENIKGHWVNVTTKEEKLVPVVKIKEVPHETTQTTVNWVARNLSQTIKYMLQKGYINKNEATSIKQVYQMEKMLAPNKFNPVISGSGETFGGPMTHELPMSDQQFIQTVGTLAQQVYKQYGGELPALTIAQAIDESGWGRSGLASHYNNLFGIKAFDWNGPKVALPTEECYNGVWVHTVSYFRVYPNWKDSIIDHGNFILDNPRYHNMIGCTSYVQQANDLVIDGYATNPSYAENLIAIINDYNLARFD